MITKIFELGNEEIHSRFNEDLTVKNLPQIVQAKLEFSMNIEKEVKFIASHSYEFEIKEIPSLMIRV